jgi:hypothetical protein
MALRRRVGWVLSGSYFSGIVLQILNSSFRRRPESRKYGHDWHLWIPACAGMTVK